MATRNSKNKRTKRGTAVTVLGAVALSLALIFVIFYAIDSFNMYWFVLMNQDSVNERRRSEDFEWYGSITGGGGGYTPGSTSNGNTPGQLYGNSTLYEPKFTSDPYEVIKYVESTLTDEQTQDPETFFRLLIYYMDNSGYVPNATIAVMANSEGECSAVSGGIMGTWLYEGGHSGSTRKGPDGQVHSTLKDNDAWRQWLEDYKGKGNGLGFYQWTYNSQTNRAIQLLDAADAQGIHWQSPSFQINYWAEWEDYNRMWNINKDTMAGVDPKESYEVTAYEWVRRLFANEMSSGYSPYTKYDMSVNTGHNQPQRVGAIDRATEIYNQYSRKDPWFYDAMGSSIYGQVNYTGPSDWHSPFFGEEYDNSTAAGRLLARIAIILASGDTSMGATKVSMGGVWGYDAPNLVECTTLQYYREALHALESGTTWYASCDRGVNTAIRLAGVDPSFPWGGTSVQYDYVTGDGKDKWKDMGVWTTNDGLQPGDVILAEGGGHVKMYIGTNIAGERWPGTTSNMYQASYGDHYPLVSRETPSTNSSRTYHVYRYVGNAYTDAGWNTFMSAVGNKFSELPRQYVTPGTIVYGDPNSQPLTSWLWPLPPENTHVSSFFGGRIHPIRKTYHDHGGTDLPAPRGTPIYATRAGTVVYSGAQDSSDLSVGYGYYCKIDHGDGTYTYYAHQKQKPIVNVGQSVSQGQIIGYVGTTGSSTGDHLHFELRVDVTDADGNTVLMRQDILQHFKGMKLQAKDSAGEYQDFIVD